MPNNPAGCARFLILNATGCHRRRLFDKMERSALDAKTLSAEPGLAVIARPAVAGADPPSRRWRCQKETATRRMPHAPDELLFRAEAPQRLQSCGRVCGRRLAAGANRDADVPVLRGTQLGGAAGDPAGGDRVSDRAHYR